MYRALSLFLLIILATPTSNDRLAVPQTAHAEPSAPCADNWEVLYARAIPSAEDMFFYNLASLNESYAVLVGRNTIPNGPTRPLAAHWVNGTLTVHPIPFEGSADGWLTTVVAKSPTEIWAAGKIYDDEQEIRDEPFLVRWNGSAWQRAVTPINGMGGEIFDLEVAPDGSVWAAGWSNNQPSVAPVVLRWNGTDWQTTPVPAINAELKRIIVTATDAWASGRFYPVPFHSGIPMLLRWNGSAWTQYDISSLGINATDIADLVADPSGGIWMSIESSGLFHWSGNAWERIPNPNTNPPLYLTAPLLAMDPDRIWSANGIADYPLWHWDGSAWQQRPMGGHVRNPAIQGMVRIPGTNDILTLSGAGLIRLRQPAIDFSNTRFSGDAAASAAQIDVRLSAAQPYSTTVQFATANGSATAGQDYTATSGTLTVPPCATRRSFQVPIQANPTWALARTVNLRLQNPIDGRLGSQNQATLAITDRARAPAGGLSLLPMVNTAPPPVPVQRVAFRGRANENDDIYTIRIDGTDLRRLTDHPAADLAPAWSPDAQRIAFLSERTGRRQIYVMQADGSGVTQLIQRPYPALEMAWSPDGRQIVFSEYVNPQESVEPARIGIMLMNSDGSGLRTLVPPDPTPRGNPSWAPDSRQIAFVQQGRIIIIDLVTGAVARPITRTVISLGVAWSPDGTQIAFCGLEGRDCQLYVLPLATGAEVPFNRNFNTSGRYLSWSPDGQQLAYSGDGINISSVDHTRPILIRESTITLGLLDIAWSPR